MTFNPFNLFILSASIHGLIFGSIVLFSKKFNTQPNRYLAFYILLVSLNNIYFWFIDTDIVAHFNWNFYWLFPIQWDLLMFPAFFYFISSYLGKQKRSKYYMYPFYISLPFCVFFLFQQVFFSNVIQISENVVKNFYIILSYISMLCTGLAIYNGFKLIVNYQKETATPGNPKINTHWLKRLLLLAILVFLIWVLITIYNTLIYRDVDIERVTSYILWISMSFLIYWMGYLGIYHLGIFSQRQSLRVQINSEKIKPDQRTSNGSKDRFNDIDNAIKLERIYTDPSISLGAIADRFNLSEGYVSQLINKHTQTNFSTYINHLRIVEAQRILIDKNYKDYTIIAIALESGFNSKSAFYTAFKKVAKMSPIAYKNKETLL